MKTIQTDTNEAVISMEQSTAGVVGGAQLAENAGSALDEIEKVANHIATLVQSISNAARQQASTAGEVSRTMNVIREITAQTTEGTNATAVSVGGSPRCHRDAQVGRRLQAAQQPCPGDHGDPSGRGGLKARPRSPGNVTHA